MRWNVAPSPPPALVAAQHVIALTAAAWGIALSTAPARPLEPNPCRRRKFPDTRSLRAC
jgi:hypothetical protein